MDNTQRKMLVVEDEEGLREMLVIVFEDEGYQVEAAENGEQAWNMLNENSYAILVTDLYMPKMNGVELIGKCQNAFPETKIVLISGGGRELEAESGSGLVVFMGEEIEIDMFLKKPYKLDELLAVLDGVFSSSLT